jgi:aspartate/methionine/tyrosine aminotransferase
MRPADRIADLGVTLIRRFLSECPADALSLGLGQLALPVPVAVARAAQRAAATRTAGYGPNAGDAALRAAIAAYEGVDASRVIVTVGVEEALALAILGTINPGDEVAVPDPAFPVYTNLTRVAGGKALAYRLDAAAGFAPTWDAIAAAITPRTRLVVLASPGNPTGAIASATELRRIATRFEERGICWLSDEIYRPFLRNTALDHGSMLSHGSEGFVVSGLSKSAAMAGWRLGWLIAPAELVEPLTALHQHLVTSASTLVQTAATAAFSPSGERFVARASRLLHANSRYAVGQLRKAGFSIAGQGAPTMYVWASLPGHDDDVALARRIAHEARVITIPGSAFGEAGRGHLRVSLGLERGRLREGVDRIAQWALSTR